MGTVKAPITQHGQIAFLLWINRKNAVTEAINIPTRQTVPIAHFPQTSSIKNTLRTNAANTKTVIMAFNTIFVFFVYIIKKLKVYKKKYILRGGFTIFFRNAQQIKKVLKPRLLLDIGYKINEITDSAFYNLLGEKNECYC